MLLLTFGITEEHQGQSLFCIDANILGIDETENWNS